MSRKAWWSTRGEGGCILGLVGGGLVVAGAVGLASFHRAGNIAICVLAIITGLAALVPFPLGVLGASEAEERAQLTGNTVAEHMLAGALVCLGARYRRQSAVLLTRSEGSEMLFHKLVRRHCSVVATEEHALGIVEGGLWNIASNEIRLPSAAREVPYESIVNVQEFGTYAVLTLVAGGTITLVADSGVREAANAIRARVQQLHVATRRAPPVPHVVERQVVVMRCRYCAQLTPAELTQCRSCGAMMGGA